MSGKVLRGIGKTATGSIAMIKNVDSKYDIVRNMKKILKEAVDPAHIKTTKEEGTSDAHNNDTMVENLDISNREKVLKDCLRINNGS